MSPSSRLSATSIGTPSRSGVRVLGEGDKMTEGTLRWRPDPVASGSSVREGVPGTAGSGSGAEKSTFGGSAGWFQSYPGLTIRLTVSPSLMLYSLSNFASARALPLRSKRCTSTGGAPGCEAR